MVRTFQRAAAFAAGLILPLGAWALVADPNVDASYSSGSVVSMDQELITADDQLLNSDQVEPRVVRADHIVADRIDELTDRAAPPEASATLCCVWFYMHGVWYCLVC